MRDPTKPRAASRACGPTAARTPTRCCPRPSRLLVYVSSYDIGAGRYRCASTGPKAHDKISVVEVPKANPAAAKVVNDAGAVPRRRQPGRRRRRHAAATHRLPRHHRLPEDRPRGRRLHRRGRDHRHQGPGQPEGASPPIEDPNFAFWHSATISQDGKKVLFTDELGGGRAPTCNPTVGPKRGADAIYDITDPANPKFMSYFKIPRTQTNQENCVAHNGNAIPVPGRDILVQSWYQGGISIIDWTDGAKPQGAGLVRPRPVVDAERRQACWPASGRRTTTTGSSTAARSSAASTCSRRRAASSPRRTARRSAR